MILTYMLILLILVNPYLFGVSSIADKQSHELILRVFFSTFFIPAFAVAMLRFLGFVQSFELPEKEERIAPYIITGIFYLWLFRNFLGNSVIPTAYTSFLLGATISLFIAFFINIFSKISAHAVGMGGLVGMVVITMLLFSYGSFEVSLPLVGTFHLDMITVLLFVIIMSGVVGTARLMLKAHEPTDLYGGYLVGFASQLIALRFLF
jgi:hypothetical protein